MNDPLFIVKLLNPETCLSCRFHSVVVVKGEGRTILCNRRDCDNWITETKKSLESSDVSPDTEQS